MKFGVGDQARTRLLPDRERSTETGFVAENRRERTFQIALDSACHARHIVLRRRRKLRKVNFASQEIPTCGLLPNDWSAVAYETTT